MKTNKVMLTFILGFVLLAQSVFATGKVEAKTIDESTVKYSQEQYKEFFQTSGVEVPENATFACRDAITSDGDTIQIAEMTVEEGNRVTTSYAIEYKKVDGIDKPVDIETTMQEIERGTFSTVMLSKTGCSVAATVQCNRITGSDGYYYYQPLSMSAVSSIQQWINVTYNISGKIYGSSTTGAHSINISQYPATANQYYSVNYPAPSYYRPKLGLHNIEFSTGSGWVMRTFD